jgi:hypothetical protein
MLASGTYLDGELRWLKQDYCTLFDKGGAKGLEIDSRTFQPTSQDAHMQISSS